MNAASCCLVDNYGREAPRTKRCKHTKDEQGLFRSNSLGSSFAILASYRKQRRAAAGPRFTPLGSRLPLVGRAVRARSLAAGRARTHARAGICARGSMLPRQRAAGVGYALGRARLESQKDL
ncbi:MAG: hypothetical protein M0Q13_13670 [Methanothrix sp.]|nr:hypothetical protein [Methanothrix sp.]